MRLVRSVWPLGGPGLGPWDRGWGRWVGVSFGGKVLRAGAVCVIVVAAVTGVWIRATSPSAETLFCKASLALVEIDGRMVAPQDQTLAGEDGRCDFDQTERAYAVLGFDCKVREPDGEVTVEVVPNRRDGTCGLPTDDDEHIPDPWPTR